MSDTNQQTQGSDPVGRLIRRAGLRDSAPEMVERRVRAKVRGAWQSSVNDRRQKRWRSLAAAAAVVAVAVIVGRGVLQSTPVTPAIAASIARVTGEVLVNGNPIAGDAILLAGDTLATSSTSRASLMFADGALRMDTGTTIRFVDGQRVYLTKGGVYVDSGARQNATPVQVLTSLGTATDIGTQFQVRLEANQLQIEVREGVVNLEQKDSIVSARAGEAIQITQDGHLSRTLVDSQDESWDWAEQLAPEFNIENRSLLEFLSWAARETGRGLTFEDDDAERSADREMLRGSIAGMDPDQALEAVRHTIESSYRVLDDQILVEAVGN